MVDVLEPVRRSTFSSADDGEITDFIRRTYAENTSRFAHMSDGAEFSAEVGDTAAFGSDRVYTSVEYSGQSPGFDDLVFFAVHSGSVHMTGPGTDRIVGRDDVAFYPIGVPIGFAMDSFDVTTLRIGVAYVQQVGHSVTGTAPDDITFLDTTPVSQAMHRYWQSLMHQVSSGIQEPDSPFDHALIAQETARTIAVAALHVFPNTTLTRTASRGPGSVFPATIRRAVSVIDERADRPLDLGAIASAAGTSPRALQYGFRRHLGITPMEHLRRVRLDRAHRELVDADPTRGDTVAAIARRWGFANPGRFATSYRATYGRSPATTLRG
ncbi:MAG: helix-turn-helix domain-containing protein [Gordonia paraffinivorans]